MLSDRIRSVVEEQQQFFRKQEAWSWHCLKAGGNQCVWPKYIWLMGFPSFQAWVLLQRPVHSCSSGNHSPIPNFSFRFKTLANVNTLCQAKGSWRVSIFVQFLSAKLFRIDLPWSEREPNMTCHGLFALFESWTLKVKERPAMAQNKNSTIRASNEAFSFKDSCGASTTSKPFKSHAGV